ncbi:hypothetical protein HDV00_011166 [Rhizophlyctis rosea]|nr:hypothetical protein HDV00_011166 [Rhizophlyctis rosea]
MSSFPQPIYFNYTQFDALCVPNAFYTAIPIFANIGCAPLTTPPAVLTLELLVYGCVYWELMFGVVPILVVNW